MSLATQASTSSTAEINLTVLLILAVLSSLLTIGYCGNHTVTDEVWFEVEIKDLDGPGINYKGRFTVALFGEAAPITCLNFRSIAKGYKRGHEKLSYKNTLIHRVVPDFVIQMGDITIGDGTGGKSIFGPTFNDEDYILGHRSAGWVAMANHGTDTNGSQFYITLGKLRWLDGFNVVFGKVIRGYDVIRTIGEVEASRETAFPLKRIRIVNCGLEDFEKKYDLDDDMLDSTEDI